MDALGMDWNHDDSARPDAEPVDPVVREAAAAWAQRAEPEQPKPKPVPPSDPAAEQPVPSVRGGYGHAPVTYQILEEAMRGLVKRERAARNKSVDAVAKAVVEKMAELFASARTKTTWRFEEAERRAAELEARVADLEASIAKMEGRADG
jgi:hypothetical protein